MSQAMFGAGCFWGVEAAFRAVDGVLDTKVGFSGGSAADPGYVDVAGGETGHVQVVLVDHDPQTVSYGALLKVFWQVLARASDHRQDRDVVAQHRPVIVYFDDEQRRTAEASLRTATGRGASGSVQIVPAGAFSPAEERHQRYYEKRGQMVKSLFGRGDREPGS